MDHWPTHHFKNTVKFSTSINVKCHLAVNLPPHLKSKFKYLHLSKILSQLNLTFMEMYNGLTDILTVHLNLLQRTLPTL